jgi:hypothetical protein
MRTQLALHDLGLLTLVYEFDRVFQANNIEISRVIEVIYHRGQRGGLAGARRTRHEKHPLVKIAELQHDWW